MLIVEGADCLGKTRLCDRLFEELQRPSQYNVERERFGLEASGNGALREFVARTRRWCVSDRHHHSEVVYGSLTRGRVGFTPQEAACLLGPKLRACGALVVVLWAEDADYGGILDAKYPEREQAFDRSACAMANRAYVQVAVNQKYAGYPLQVDGHRCVRVAAGGAPYWPSGDDALVRNIVGEYCRRQKETDE